jgi:hypothetical protein
MVAGRKIPPHFARELKRHVTKQTQSTSSSASNTNSIMKTLFGCVAFGGVTASIPYFALQWISPLNDRDEALTHSQIRRGAFNNSGSRDAGRDPYWDFKSGTRIKNEEYIDLFLKDNPNELEHGDRFKP